MRAVVRRPGPADRLARSAHPDQRRQLQHGRLDHRCCSLSGGTTLLGESFANNAESSPWILITDLAPYVSSSGETSQQGRVHRVGARQETVSMSSSVQPVGSAGGPGQDPGSVDPAAKQVRRTFTAEYRARVVAEYAAAPHGEKSAVLRREGLYQSQIREWTDARDAIVRGLPPKRHSHHRSGKSVGSSGAERLRAENARLTRELAKSQAVVEIMGNCKGSWKRSPGARTRRRRRRSVECGIHRAPRGRCDDKVGVRVGRPAAGDALPASAGSGTGSETASECPG